MPSRAGIGLSERRSQGGTRGKRVTVRAPARLHLGFLDLEGGLGRRFGSLGLTVEGLETQVHVERAPAFAVEADSERDRARAMLEAHEVAITPDERRTVRFPAVVPKLSATPGAVERLGPALGEHSDAVYGGLLGLDTARIAALREAGVI